MRVTKINYKRIAFHTDSFLKSEFIKESNELLDVYQKEVSENNDMNLTAFAYMMVIRMVII